MRGTVLNLTRIIAERIRTRGFRRTASNLLYRLDDELALRRLGIHSAMRETGVSVCRNQLGIQNPNCYSYNPSESYRVFRTVVRQFLRPTQHDVFLDYGSGLGRVLLMAATFPFRRVIGVEYS